MELVSVVVSTYNGAKYLKEQIDSILQQTYSPMEIIIIDDASTDETQSIAANYCSNHSNVFLHAFENNVGYIKNFERGIALAKGSYIALSDQDDWWDPTKISKLMNCIGSYDLAYCDSSFVDENLNSMHSSFSKKKNLIHIQNPLQLLLDNVVSGHACIFRSELYKQAIPFPESIPHDWWLAYVASVGNGIFYLNQPLIKYRHHSTNIIASVKKEKKNRKNKKSKKQKFQDRRNRIDAFLKKCPEYLKEEKEIISAIKKSYQNFSLINNIKRVSLFFKNRKILLSIMKKTLYQKLLFVLNMFFRIK